MKRSTKCWLAGTACILLSTGLSEFSQAAFIVAGHGWAIAAMMLEEFGR